MIIHVTPSYPPRLGGLEKVVQVLANAQLKLGLDVSVITSSHGSRAGLTHENFPVLRLRGFELANTTVLPNLFSRLLRVKRGDMVHLHITQAFTPEMVWLAAKIKRFKYISHIHIDAPPSGAAGFLLKIYKPLFLKRVLRRSNQVVVFTEDQKQEVRQKYSVAANKITVIPNGVETQFFNTAPRKLHSKPRLLFVGRLNFQKNIPQLFEALRGISGKFQTNIIGEGELKEELQKKAAALGLKNLVFCGRIEGRKLLDSYRQADIFVLPSEREGMPLVLLEAMAMGLPIIATNVTGSRDVVQGRKNGLLVPHKDSNSLRLALLELGFDQQLYSKLHKNAYLMAQQYSWDKIALRFKYLYEEQS